jgi:hypothetical protein
VKDFQSVTIELVFFSPMSLIQEFPFHKHPMNNKLATTINNPLLGEKYFPFKNKFIMIFSNFLSRNQLKSFIFSITMINFNRTM